jgi:hypothetical protein
MCQLSGFSKVSETVKGEGFDIWVEREMRAGQGRVAASRPISGDNISYTYRILTKFSQSPTHSTL